MLRTNPTFRSVTVLVVLLALCCAGAAIIGTNLSRPLLASRRTPELRILWSVPAKGICSMAFSPSGQRICLVARDGTVGCYTSKGAMCFSTRIPGVDRVLVVPDGSCFMVYSHLNPMNTGLTFLDRRGRVHWRMDVSGAVWSADAGECDDGPCFAVGTGGKHVYLITIRGNHKRYRRWRTPGAVSSVALTERGEDVVFGTWQDSAISRTTLTGQRVWEDEADSASLQYIQSLTGSDRLFLCSVPNRSDADAEAVLLSADGETVWRHTLDSAQHTRALPSPDGLYVCTGYEKLIVHKGKSMREKHTALFDDSGTQLWDKGSLFFQAAPIAVVSGGYVVASGGGNSLFTISPGGELKKACDLPAAVASVMPSPDSSRALIRCTDGKAYLVRIVQ